MEGKKGWVGDPKNQSKGFADPENRKKAGRPKGSRNRSTVVREILEAVSKKDNAKSVEADITYAVAAKALEGDVQAYKALMDSAYGPAATALDIDGDALPFESKNIKDFWADDKTE